MKKTELVAAAASDCNLTRRSFLSTGAAAMAAGALATTAGCATSTPAVKAAVPAAGATGLPAPFVGAGIESVSAQAMYTLPRDHAYHGGAFYQTNDFNEWQYITILGKDLDTGDDISVFWVPLSQGWMADEGRPLMNCLFAYHNIRTGEFKTAMIVLPGKFNSEGSAADAEDFWFRYHMTGPTEAFSTEYQRAGERWHFKGSGTKSDANNAPFDLNFVSTAKFPGYVPSVYFGLESIGVDPQDRQNPETMYGLTYYYVAPQMETTGTLKLADKTVRFSGMGWFEHQWGNFRNTYQYRYFYGYARLVNGDSFGWRQYYEGPNFTQPHYDVGRFQYLHANGRREHAFGQAFKAEPMKWWTSPKTGRNYPWWGKMTTPKGVFYYGPSHPDQEGIALAGGYIEGVLQFREGSPDGPIVGTGFCEMVSLTDPFPDGRDPSEGPTITRGLPENPNLPWRPTGAR